MRTTSRALALLTLIPALHAPAPAAPSDTGLPPDPAAWVCADPTPPVDPLTWCRESRQRRSPARLGVAPVAMTDVDGKNAYDTALRDFLVARRYRATDAEGEPGLDWYGDLSWRLTGPIVGPLPSGGSFTGASYGVHPAVRIYYSPEVVDWLCGGRQGAVVTGAMIVKEMRGLDATPIAAPDGCMEITAEVEPESWTVMVKGNGETFDGWYWANPSAATEPVPPPCPSRQAFPSFLDASAITDPGFWDADCAPGAEPTERLDAWYPTGLGAGRWSNVYPWSLFSAYCVNCHASAESELTYSSLDNILTSGIRYRNFSATSLPLAASAPSDARHSPTDVVEGLAAAAAPGSPYPPSLAAPAPGFQAFFGADLEPASYADAWRLRLPSETRDHYGARPGAASEFLTSDQCIGCHDATLSNAATPNMLVDAGGAQVNVSPYGEWRVSPMGLAGRDPIFFSQLQSEVLALPELGPCIENTCLHCHGVMGQRQFASDHPGGTEAPCKEGIFAIDPPAGVPFADEPYRRAWLDEWQQTEHSGYAALSRDGISCTVCHRIAADSLTSGESGYTGNFVTADSGELFGPYADDTVVARPMEHAIERTPTAGLQITDSGLCNSCHNILLPVFDNDGAPHRFAAPDGTVIQAKYEQTTGLEWTNSVFSSGDTFQSCQDCHMPDSFHGESLAGTRIANIEDSGFAPTTHRLPDEEIALTPRDRFARHSLHGLNLFLNQMFQQFPILLGFRQIDYMTAGTVQPPLVTGQESMLQMAAEQTAGIEITTLEAKDGALEATVLVTNNVGHFLPSGVGFRRLFIELVVESPDGKEKLFASGLTNHLGVLVEYGPATCGDLADPDTCAPAPGEDFYADQTTYQPHYQTIDAPGQVQIYQELIKDSAGNLTTSFLRRVEDVKDNRLRSRGFDPAVFARSPSPYIQELAHVFGAAAKDPYYTDPTRTGADEIRYVVPLAAKPGKVTATLYSQSIPPSYLQQRFADARRTADAAANGDIRRLYYIASRLNTQRLDVPEAAARPIADWKLLVAADCRHVDGGSCAPAGGTRQAP